MKDNTIICVTASKSIEQLLNEKNDTTDKDFCFETITGHTNDVSVDEDFLNLNGLSQEQKNDLLLSLFEELNGKTHFKTK